MSAHDIGRVAGKLWARSGTKLALFGGAAALLSSLFLTISAGNTPVKVTAPVVVVAPTPIPQTKEEKAAIKKQAQIDKKERIKKAVAEAKKLAEIKKKEGVGIGMSKNDAIASSWGKPRKINTTINAYGTREQWVYDGGYLYFNNGILTSIQN